MERTGTLDVDIFYFLSADHKNFPEPIIPWSNIFPPLDRRNFDRVKLQYKDNRAIEGLGEKSCR
jgi:hypothetical protein